MVDESYLPAAHRMLPASPDAEKGYLGSVLLLPDVMDEFPVHPDQLHIPAHVLILQTISHLRRNGSPCDFISVTEALAASGNLGYAGGAALITGLFTIVPTPANAAYYAEIIREKYTLRSLLKACTDCAARCYDEQESVPELIETIERQIFEISTARYRKTGTPSMGDNMAALIDRLQAIMDGTSPAGLKTGIRALDNKLGGLHDGEMIIIQGVTGGGKTSLAHNIIDHAAIELGRPTLLWSFEMPRLQVTSRMISARARIDTEAMRKGKLTEVDMQSFGRFTPVFERAPITIEDNADTGLDEIRSRSRKWKSQTNGALIVVDYLQKIPHTGRKNGSRQREVAEISDGLQKMAMELNVPVIALSQQNDDGEVREARDIAFDAKTVLKITRDDTVLIEDEPQCAPRSIIVAKNNNGSIGKLDVVFLKNFVKFVDVLK
jgi:replicative DNA helicase